MLHSLKNINQRCLVLLWLLMLAAGVTPVAAARDTLQNDSSRVSLRKLDEKAVAAYGKKREFRYDDKTPPPGLLERLRQWLWDRLVRFLSTPGTGTFVKYLLAALAVGLLAFFLIKLAGVDLRMVAKKSKSISIPYDAQPLDIHEIDFDDQLRAAIQRKAFRLAVRLLYLGTLKTLADRGMIDWKLEKTNQAYVAELADEQQRKVFGRLTRQFEYIWYGDFPVNEQGFGRIEELFRNFNREVK